MTKAWGRKNCFFCSKEFVLTVNNKLFCSHTCAAKSTSIAPCITCSTIINLKTSKSGKCRKCFLNSQGEHRKPGRKVIDPAFYKADKAIRALICASIKFKGFKKNAKTTALLSCSIEEFKKHIENQFILDMNWFNHGSMWWFDHICPCSQAQNEEELIKLQHYTNLRPMLKIENIQKSDSITDEGKVLCVTLLNRNWN